MGRQSAVIIGASIGGLVAAQVLQKYFTKVTLIEKDSFEGERKGTPQSRHVHILLVKGMQILSKIFSGFEEALENAGAVKTDFIKNARYLVPTGWTPRFDSGLVSYSCTRSLLEDTVRKFVIKNSKIEILSGYRATGFQKKDDKVSSVSIENLYTLEKKDIQCDLVLDASGRNSELPTWLEKLGYEKPLETRVNSDIGYATRYFEIPENFAEDWNILVILNRPPNQPKMGGIFKIEKNCWIVTMYSIGKEHPPTDDDGFLKFAKSLPDDKIYETIKNLKPISQIFGYRIDGSRLRHYDDTKLPENLIAFGDSVCTFNPFYGQGMTVIALSAQVLDDALKQNDLENFSSVFHKKLSKKISYPWILATGEDFRWTTTKGKQPSSLTRIIQNYVDKVLLSTPRSPRATLAFQEMMQMVKSPLVMFHPKILIKALLVKSSGD